MKSISIEHQELQLVLDQVAEVAGYFWENRWAERNGGNISVNVTDYVPTEIGNLSEYTFRSHKIDYPELAGFSFFITGTGKRMRDMARRPEGNGCIIRIHEKLDGYHVIWGAARDPHIKPTSEFPSHLAIHHFLLHHKPDHKVILHTHPTHMVALTHVIEHHRKDELNRILWSMHPEMKVFIPDGVAVVPYRLPGSEAIARATVDYLKHHRVVLWEKHGILATGDDILDTFDVIDMAKKAAEIYLTCKNAGFEPAGLSAHQLDELDDMSRQWHAAENE
jgi:rhamnulose-1-phosphate aldolase